MSRSMPRALPVGGTEGDRTMIMGKLAVETGLFVLFEQTDGTVTRVKKVVRKPVEEYLKVQKRFAHLFKPARNETEIARIQAVADKNAEKFGIDIKLKKPAEKPDGYGRLRRRPVFFDGPQKTGREARGLRLPARRPPGFFHLRLKK